VVCRVVFLLDDPDIGVQLALSSLLLGLVGYNPKLYEAELPLKCINLLTKAQPTLLLLPLLSSSPSPLTLCTRALWLAALLLLRVNSWCFSRSISAVITSTITRFARGCRCDCFGYCSTSRRRPTKTSSNASITCSTKSSQKYCLLWRCSLSLLSRPVYVTHNPLPLCYADAGHSQCE
jgi:hypothetical protein